MSRSRDGIAQLLSAEKDIELVGAAATGGDAVELIEAQRPDSFTVSLAWDPSTDKTSFSYRLQIPPSRFGKLLGLSSFQLY